MLIKIAVKSGTAIAEGTYAATLSSIIGKPNEEAPKKALLGFKIDGVKDEVTKETPFSFDEGTPLRNTVETLNGGPLTSAQATQGFDLSTLIGKPCQVVVFLKPSPGGGYAPSVALINPPVSAAA